MARDCGPGKWVEFRAADRDFVTWNLGGVSEEAVGIFDLENDENWHGLTIDHASNTGTALFAGEDFPVPGSAVIVPSTSHIRLRITDGSVRRDLDGGFIRLVT